MQLDDNSIDLVITFLEQGDESALNTFINLSLFPDEDRNDDFSELIASIKALQVKDVKSIRSLLNPKKKKVNTLEFEEGRKGFGFIEQEENDLNSLNSESIDPIDEILNKIQNANFLDNTEKNILASFYDYNLIDSYSKSLSKRMFYHILRTAQVKFHIFW